MSVYIRHNVRGQLDPPTWITEKIVEPVAYFDTVIIWLRGPLGKIQLEAIRRFCGHARTELGKAMPGQRW